MVASQILLRQARVEDAERLAEISFSDPSELMLAIHRGGITPSVLAETAQKYAHDLRDPSIIITVATESVATAAGRETIVGFAKWRIFEATTSAPISTMASGVGIPPDATTAEDGFLKDPLLAMRTGLNEGRERYTSGRAHARLSNLFTAVDRQRKGVGSLLMAHGLTMVDAKGLFAFLEATPVAIPLYARFGFCEVGHFDVDVGAASADGSQRPYRMTFMAREASSSSSLAGHAEQSTHKEPSNDGAIP